MTLLLILKALACALVGLLGVPLGILPSIFLFRDLANGTDANESSKRNYALTLWVGMALGWLLTTWLAWAFLHWMTT